MNQAVEFESCVEEQLSRWLGAIPVLVPILQHLPEVCLAQGRTGSTVAAAHSYVQLGHNHRHVIVALSSAEGDGILDDGIDHRISTHLWRESQQDLLQPA